nr:ABC transporter ATP-binding protein [Bacilli bacterium]
NLDARLRLQTREEIRHIQQSTGITTVFVTHDQEEAMSISDKIVVMKLGLKQQEGVPQDVYNNPCNKFVANFLGTPPINLFQGRIEGRKVMIGDDCVRLITDEEAKEAEENGRDISDQEVTVGIRPEGIVIDENAEPNFHFRVERILTMGRDIMLMSDQDHRLSDTKFVIDAFTKVSVGDVQAQVKPHKCFVFSLKDDEPRLI